ncbi:MAG: class SAM-dependent methyltransferase [Actinomycetia bacterium]|nr:class SAM-dependent methyltransferase [Actinomycetes bacterium]
MSELHPATRGFADADVYERGRPDYPAAAVARIVSRLELRPGRTVLDLAAGTGKLTRLLVPSGANLLVVEPLREMRRELELRAPGVVALAGTAERIPLTASYVDAVTVGSAFHWFRPDEALREIHRVLRPGGGVALIWNARDERHPVQAALSEVIDPLQGDAPRRKERDWRSLLGESGLFERCERSLFEHEQVLDEQGLVERVVSISFIAAAPQPVRDEVVERVRAIARRSEQPIRLPYMTELYLGYAVS